MYDSMINIRLDDETREMLEDHARKFYRKPNGDGNISEAIRQILIQIFELAQHPDVAEMLKSNIVINENIMVFLRVATEAYIKNERAETTGEI